MNDRVHLAQMAEVGRLLQCLLPDGAEVNVVNRRVRKFFGIVLRRQPVEPIVRDFGHSDVGIARIRGRRQMRLGENAEQRRFAYLRQADDSGFHGRASSCWLLAVYFEVAELRSA